MAHTRAVSVELTSAQTDEVGAKSKDPNHSGQMICSSWLNKIQSINMNMRRRKHQTSGVCSIVPLMYQVRGGMARRLITTQEQKNVDKQRKKVTKLERRLFKVQDPPTETT